MILITLKGGIIIETKVKLNHFGYAEDLTGIQMKKYLNTHYFSSYLKNPDFVYALLYSRGYIRKSHSVSVESVYITNLTEDDRKYSWRRSPKPEKYIRYTRCSYDDGTNCVVLETNNQRLTLKNLIKRFKVNFDCVVVYRGIDQNRTISNNGIYRYINKKLVSIELLSPFEGF